MEGKLDFFFFQQNVIVEKRRKNRIKHSTFHGNHEIETSYLFKNKNKLTCFCNYLTIKMEPFYKVTLTIFPF
jgi:hypothetical protein